MEISSVNIGLPQTIIYQGKELTTGIYKSPISSPLFVSKNQLDGDGQADLVYHGGLDKALCVYSEEHYPYWEQVLERKLEPGSFGENLTVRGLLEADICIGDTFQIGEAIVQVSQPRQPCHKLAKRHDVVDLAIQVQETGYTGFYFRVLREGVISARSSVQLLTKDEAGVTIAFANHIKYLDRTNREGVERVLAVEALSVSWRNSFAKHLVELQA